MTHILVFNAQDDLIAEMNPPDVPISDAKAILNLVGEAVVRYTSDPRQSFTARVEDENGKGFWMHVGRQEARP